MSNKLELKSKLISLYEYKSLDLSKDMPEFKPDFEQLERDIKRIQRANGTEEQAAVIKADDIVEISCESEMARYNKESVPVLVGRGLYHKALETELIGMRAGEEKEILIDNKPVKIHVISAKRTVMPELTDENIKAWNMEGIHSAEDLKRYCIDRQIDAFRDEDEKADFLVTFVSSSVLDKSSFILDEEEVKCVQKSAAMKIQGMDFSGEENQEEVKELIYDIYLKTLKAATIGYRFLEKNDCLLTEENYADEIENRRTWLKVSKEQAMEEYTQFDYMLEYYSGIFFDELDKFVGEQMKSYYARHMNDYEDDKYDVAIIGAGPAGLSAALNLKLYNKKVIWFGTNLLSDKVEKSEKIANYPGLGLLSGKDLNKAFRKHIEEQKLSLTDKMVTAISVSGNHYMVLADNEIFQAKTILLATGSVSGKGTENEQELLGHGVSYCATCDGFLYSGKTIAVYCGAKRYEHEVAYLAEIAEKVYLFAGYGDSEINLPNVEHLKSNIKGVCGEKRVEGIRLMDGTEIAVDGVFFLRSAVAPATLLKGLKMDGPHIAVNRDAETNLPGCFAAGDCTGRPYQIAVAVGEGNVAAHSIVKYLAETADKK